MLSILPKEFIFSLIRAALTAGGTWMVTKGISDSDSVQAVIGGIMGTVSIAWSHWVHTP